MSVFFTADTHFGHAAIIRYCNRPFESVETMNQTLLETWNAVVRPTDIVYHLGDVFFRSKEEERTLTFVRKLHGKKYLVPGNHDQARHLEQLTGHFTVLPPLHEVTFRDKGESARTILCHYPLETWNGVSRGSLMLHGHVHGTLPGNRQRTDVGVDAWNWMPVNLEQILARVQAETVLPAEPLGKRGYAGSGPETEDGDDAWSGDNA